jgi:proteasome lid subunit RPN8/RPN11
MGMEISMTREIVPALLTVAAGAHPDEACGLLLGHVAAGRVVVTQVAQTANVAADPARHFEIDPAALIAAHRAARTGGAAVIGYFHSHPTGVCAPSVTDIAMAARDGLVWAIIAGGAVGWWRDGANGFEVLSTSVAGR